MKSIIARLDGLQQRRSWAALPLAVFKRFGEHHGAALGATVSYWSFFSIFPLMLAFVTILNVVLEDEPDTREDLVDGALGQVPVIGTQLADTAAPLGGSWVAIAVGVAVALWSGLAAANALQAGYNEIWDVPQLERPKGAVKRLRALAFLVALAVGLSLSTFAVSATQIIDLGPLTWVAGLAVSFVANAAIVLAGFVLLTADRRPLGELLPGTLLGAAAIVGLQALGTWIVTRYIAGASDTYGTFAIVIALLSWFYLVSRVLLLCCELNAVIARQLSPRSLLPESELTDGDRRAALSDARRVVADPRIDVAIKAEGEAAEVVEPVRAEGS